MLKKRLKYSLKYDELLLVLQEFGCSSLKKSQAISKAVKSFFNYDIDPNIISFRKYNNGYMPMELGKKISEYVIANKIESLLDLAYTLKYSIICQEKFGKNFNAKSLKACRKAIEKSLMQHKDFKEIMTSILSLKNIEYTEAKALDFLKDELNLNIKFSLLNSWRREKVFTSSISSIEVEYALLNYARALPQEIKNELVLDEENFRKCRFLLDYFKDLEDASNSEDS